MAKKRKNEERLNEVRNELFDDVIIDTETVPDTDRDENAEFEERVRRIMARYEAQVRKSLGRGIRPLHEIEAEVQRIGDDMTETLTDEIIREAGTGQQGSRLLCACGETAKYKGLHLRHLVTLHGRIPILRAYYHCSWCQAGFCPLDDQLRLGQNGCSRRVQADIARLCSYLPFALATQELEALRGVKLSATTVQNTAKQVGNRLGQEWNARHEQAQAGQSLYSGRPVARLYGSMDGVKAHVGGRWRDIKLGVFYQRNLLGRVTDTLFYGSLQTSSEFGPRLRTLGILCGLETCSDLEIVADGAEWIWNETQTHFPKSVQVLDFYHLSEHLWDVSDARFGKESEAGREWMATQKGRLLRDEARLVTADIIAWEPRSQGKKEIRRKAICYMQTHQDRTAYKTLRDAGYHIGSGVMECGCKRVVKSRLGGAGMRWEEAGALAVLPLSAHWRSVPSGDFLAYTN